MRIPRTFTLPADLSDRLNQIERGERSRFVERALETALAQRAKTAAEPLEPTPLPKIAPRR